MEITNKIADKDFYIYGTICGFIGKEPEYRKKLKLLLFTNNIIELESWLESEIPEIRVYAIDGFYQLLKNGYILTSNQASLIMLIGEQDNQIRVCSGCHYSIKTIKSTVKKIVDEFYRNEKT